MKKYLFILATVAIVASCSDNGTFKEISTPDEAIGFTTYTGKLTRADESAENSSATAKDALEAYNTTFKVWGSKFLPDGDDEGTDLDEVRVFGINNTGEVVTHDGANWTYSPARFWDKSATSYSFYAAAPSGKSWVWDNSTKKLSLVDFALSGYNSVTGNPATEVDVDKVLTENVDTEDLMISTDVTGYNTYTSAAVNLQFNHILSRLNIGVRKATTLDAFDVKLNSIKVFNMKSNGTFNENLASGTDLSGGTIARWATAPTTQAKFTTGVGYVPANALLITSTETAPSTYQYVYEGLVIPQAVAYNPTVEVNDYVANQTPAHFRMDGQDVSNDANPYIVIDYEIWTKAVAAVNFTQEEIDAAQEGDPAYGKSTSDVKTPEVAAAKMDGYKYYYNLADVFNADATTAVNFCEGWQNTLKITLAPVAIEFDADVYEWATKVEQGVYVTDEPAANNP